MISIIHPSRSRPEKSSDTVNRWCSGYGYHEIELIISVDFDDPKLSEYQDIYGPVLPNQESCLFISNNKSSVEAINNAAKLATGDILLVVSDDTVCPTDWVAYLLKEFKDKTDWILKTQDGIQNYIITMPVMDRAYYNRFGYIYHPDFQHLFCDTYMTCVADITGRKITSNLLFKHNHYSVGGATMDEVNKKNDATWKQGEETFIRLMKQFTPEERNRISDQSMKNWLRNHGVR